MARRSEGSWRSCMSFVVRRTPAPRHFVAHRAISTFGVTSLTPWPRSPDGACRAMEGMLSQFQHSFQTEPRAAGVSADAAIQQVSRRVLGAAHSGGFATEAWEVFIALSSTGVEMSPPLGRLTCDALSADGIHQQRVRALRMLMAAERRSVAEEGNDMYLDEGDVVNDTRCSSSESFGVGLVRGERLLYEAKLAGTEEEFQFLVSKMRQQCSGRHLGRRGPTTSLWWCRRISYALLLHPRRTVDHKPGAISTWSPQLRALLSLLPPPSALLYPTHSELHGTAEWDAQLLQQAMKELLLPRQAHNVVVPPISMHPATTSAGEDEADLSRFSYYIFPRHSHHRLRELLRRRRFTQLLVPDAAFLLSKASQLEELSRAREVIITHQVFIQLLHVAEGGDLHTRGGWWKQIMPFSGACSPHRFRARRILCHLLSRAAPREEEDEDESGVRPAVLKRRRSRRRHAGKLLPQSATAHEVLMASVQRCKDQSIYTSGEGGGVTLLGLSDELELQSRWPPSYQSLTMRSARCGLEEDEGVVRCAIALEGILAQERKREAWWDTPPPSTATSGTKNSVDEDDAMESFFLNPSFSSPVITPSSLSSLSNCRETVKRKTTTARHTQPTPHSQGKYWARQPVVVVTAQEATRELAFRLGVQTFPPATAILPTRSAAPSPGLR